MDKAVETSEVERISGSNWSGRIFNLSRSCFGIVKKFFINQLVIIKLLGFQVFLVVRIEEFPAEPCAVDIFELKARFFGGFTAVSR